MVTTKPIGLITCGIAAGIAAFFSFAYGGLNGQVSFWFLAALLGIGAVYLIVVGVRGFMEERR